MKRVTGLGGVFFQCNDPEKMKEWYRAHLGMESGKDGAVFKWRDFDAPEKKCITAWSIFPAETKYFDPSQKPFMFNYRVENLKVLLDELREEGVTVVGEIEEYEYGKFGWILDSEGNKIELWEPIDDTLL
ncbi:MAG: VOC family protein [Ignavibacteriales bacterium]|nr:VOC family protein [Ignavibacteriales bacterium]